MGKDKVQNAITKARQARFEHGESPTREINKATTGINKIHSTNERRN